MPSPATQLHADISTLASLPPRALAELELALHAHFEDAGFTSQAEAKAYLHYLENLMAGLHEPRLLEALSLPALQQGAAILLLWHAWLEQEYGEQRPDCGDRITLASISLIQGLIAQKIARHRTLDALLPGAGEFPDKLEHAHTFTQSGRSIALIQVELPQHLPLAPEQLMPEVATRIMPILREHDALFLIDRHTIGLLFANLAGTGHAMLAANRVNQSFEEMVENGGLSLRLHPRIGIALYPDHAQSADDLLAAAAIATHRFASDEIGLYEPERDRIGQLLQKLEVPLRDALRENRFHLALQPQVGRHGASLHGMEALLRWQDEILGNIPPSEIVMVAEQMGLMASLTRWVIQASLREFRTLLLQGIPGQISINLAAESLYDRELPDVIANALAVWHVPGNRVVFEITESALIENIESAAQSLHKLKALGCKLALDDFGTGYSSLNYLKALPIDELKIDASFIRGLKTSEKDAHIVATVIELAHKLGITVISEGVEDEETARLLEAAGNDVIQGYFYSRPLPPAQLPDFVQKLAQRFPA